uniref:Serine/threonineprotein kinase moslike [Hydra vulgaris] n=2 Tax=Lepeophtheirus salmonis TaxID=72036 RepID=A0A0K2UMH0_LEPSM
MEYVGKTNLQQLINENKQILNESFIHRCLKDLSDALSHCHYKGMWHLDVKPSNVFVTSRGVCKLGDFGCSRLAGVSQDADFLVGTPGYQAPEMLQYQYASDKCDVYSFGVLCWQVIRKEIPYDGVHPHTIVYKVVSENFRPPDSTSLPSYFKPYQQIYRKSWDQNPKRRPDMKDIFLEIQSITVSRKISSSIKIRI